MFGTERARLGGDGLRTERASLAQVGFWGQFYKRNPFKRNFRKPQNFAKKFLTEDPILGTLFSKNPDPHKEFFFREGNSPTCSEY